MMHLRIFLWFFFISLSGFSQDYIYQHFGVDEGLPGSELYDIYQDKHGYIWFASDKGLSKYNGYEFENYDVNDGLTGNVILKFYPQENGEIWCYTLHNQALFYFDEVFKKFHPYKNNSILKKELGPKSIIKSVWVSKDKSVHIGGYEINGELIIENNGNVLRRHTASTYDPKTVYTILKNKTNASEAPFLYTSNKVEDIFYTDYKAAHLMGCWLIDNQKAVLYNGEAILIKERGKEDIVVKSDFQTIRIEKIDSKRFFVGYRYGGGVIFNDRGEVETTFLENKSVSDLFIDHHGGYWFTTSSSGVYYIKSPSIKYMPTPKVDNANISTMTSDGSSLFVGYEDGTLAKIDQHRQFQILKASLKTSPAFVEYDREYQKLLYYNSSVLKDFYSQSDLLQQHSLNISKPHNGNVLVAATYGFSRVDYNGAVQEFYSPYRVLDVMFWKDHYYTATPKGVFKYIGDSIVSLGETTKLLTYRVDDVDVSAKNDRLFMGTQGAGMIVYGEQVFNISKKDGLYSDLINQIHVENDSVIWVCTNKGLNQVILKGSNFVVKGIDKEMGLLSNEIKDVEVIGDTVWVGTNEGLCYFPKALLKKVSNQKSFLEIKTIQTNGEVHEKSDKLELRYHQNTVDFSLQEISFTHQSNIEYPYRLLGLSNAWKSTTSRTIRFSPLPDGEYVFEAKACANDVCFDKIVQQRFVITPPFWRTWWFYSLCLLAIGGVIYLFFKIRVLTYNKDLTREFIRLLVKRMKKKEKFLTFRELGNDVKIKSDDILYIKSANNYINIVTANKSYTVRMGIGKFLEQIPDKLEYVRIHRSYIIRLDKVTSKSKNELFINAIRIPVGQRYLSNLKKIHF